MCRRCAFNLPDHTPQNHFKCVHVMVCCCTCTPQKTQGLTAPHANNRYVPAFQICLTLSLRYSLSNKFITHPVQSRSSVKMVEIQYGKQNCAMERVSFVNSLCRYSFELDDMCIHYANCCCQNKNENSCIW